MIKALKLEGTSMKPLFKDGEIVLYENNIKKINIGDCLIYNYQGKILLHRVIKKTNDKILISNDDNLPEHYIEKKDILGKVKKNFLTEGFSGFLYHKSIKFIRKICSFLPN